MKFIHTADLHFNKERSEKVIEVINKIIDVCKADDISGVFITGDFWDSTITNSKSSGFTDALSVMKALADTVPVFMIYGTASHEPAGSLDVFEKIGCVLLKDNRANHKANPYMYSYHSFYDKTDTMREFDIVAIPEPRLSMTDGKTLEDKYNSIQKSFKDIVFECKLVKKDCPRIVLFHGLISGAVMDNGMSVPKGETAIDKEVLDSMNADVILCGHIHKKQKVGGMKTPCYYCGSIPPKNFGETHEASFNIIEV